MEREWNDALLKHDASWFERNDAFDASDISSRTGAIMTKAQAVADARTDKTDFQSLTLSDLTVRVEGNTAVVTGVNHEVGRDAQGKPSPRALHGCLHQARRALASLGDAGNSHSIAPRRPCGRAISPMRTLTTNVIGR
ncbi:MAG: nuclear transport factor 2 family protein [Gemmatimonadaceae bacterium]